MKQAGQVWRVWLWAATIGLCLFGLSMLLTPDLIRWAFSWMLYGDGERVAGTFGAPANEYIHLMHGVMGAVMFGWGVMIAMLLKGPIAQGQPGSINWILVPVVAWYIPDTAFSLYTGFWQNAVLNSGFAILFLVPLLALKRAGQHE